jgi:hypothetical protein
LLVVLQPHRVLQLPTLVLLVVGKTPVQPRQVLQARVAEAEVRSRMEPDRRQVQKVVEGEAEDNEVAGLLHSRCKEMRVVVSRIRDKAPLLITLVFSKLLTRILLTNII